MMTSYDLITSCKESVYEAKLLIIADILKYIKCVWSACKKRDIHESRMVVERSKLAKHIMVSAGVCYGGKGRLHFIPDKAKGNAQFYAETLLPRLIEDCKSVLPSSFIFQQDCSHGKVGSRLYCHQLQ